MSHVSSLDKCHRWRQQNGTDFGDTVLASRRCWVAGNKQKGSWIVQQIRATSQASWDRVQHTGRHCKPSDEINLICVMYLNYLDLCVTCAIVGQMPSLKAIKRYRLRRHGFSQQALLSRSKYVKLKLDHSTDQGDFASCMGPRSINQVLQVCP